MRRTDQNRLIRPYVEPHVGLAPTWKAPRGNAHLARLAKLQIAIFRRELDRQPLVRNGKLAHISRVPSRGLVCFMLRGQPTSRSIVRSCRSALLPRLARFRQEVPARFPATSPAFVPARSIHQFRVLQLRIGSRCGLIGLMQSRMLNAKVAATKTKRRVREESTLN